MIEKFTHGGITYTPEFLKSTAGHGIKILSITGRDSLGNTHGMEVAVSTATDDQDSVDQFAYDKAKEYITSR